MGYWGAWRHLAETNKEEARARGYQIYSEGQMEVLKKRQKELNDMHIADFTRAEAIQKCHGINHPECFVQALEAMGLIKFKEPESKTPESVLRKSIERQLAHSTGEIDPNTLIVALRMKGYEIVRREAF